MSLLENAINLALKEIQFTAETGIVAVHRTRSSTEFSRLIHEHMAIDRKHFLLVTDLDFASDIGINLISTVGLINRANLLISHAN